jgi:hypothetical protein
MGAILAGIGMSSQQQNEQRRNVMVEHVTVETEKRFFRVSSG